MSTIFTFYLILINISTIARTLAVYLISLEENLTQASLGSISWLKSNKRVSIKKPRSREQYVSKATQF